MEITPKIKEILQSISGRSKKYGKFGLSKYEYDKFGLTERTLRTIINKLREEGYITFVVREWYSFLPGNIRSRNIFTATDKLLDLVQSFMQKVVDLNDKIIAWCGEQDPIATLLDHGIELFGYSIGKRRSGITVDTRTGCISNWKTGKKWNLFNYLRDHEGQGVLEFYNNFIAN